MQTPLILAGCSVLVVEDDFYLADDSRIALEKAGATVLGPCGNVADALDILKKTKPDCAVVDVNLGNGPNFEVAKALKASATPVMLVTGYDQSAIPPEFLDIQRLLKPVCSAKLVEAVAKLCSRRSTNAVDL